MSTPKKKREKTKRKREPRRQREHGPERSAPIGPSSVKLDICRDISQITQLAHAEDARIVTLGNLVFFSTRTRDVWLLDREDDLAICLCRDGEPQPFRIIDDPDTFAIEWTASFAIDGAAFVVQERSGRVVVTQGYPIIEISAACQG